MGDALLVTSERSRIQAEIADPRLKRLLLEDPQGASYWDAEREGIGISLGEASTLTIACMLGDLYQHLQSEGLDLGPDAEIPVRFSLPNWIGDDPKHRAARRRMYQTTVVSCALIKSLGWDKLPRLRTKNNIGAWKETVRRIRANPDVAARLADVPTSFSDMVERDFTNGDVRWRLAAESSAAGYLPLTDLLREVPKNSHAQKHWVKLLVVDVGAGSTDTGYFVSSRTLRDHELMMNYLPPARTLDFAGERLTEMLRDYYLREHGRDLSIEEAEIMKISAPDKWNGQQFVKDWRNRIAKSVADYIRHVPDELRLGEPEIPGLKIVLTGGSGLVLGLDNAVKEAVVDALAMRGVAGNVAGRTEVIQFRARAINDRVDAARRAVSVGAGQTDFALLSYRDSFTRPKMRVVAGSSWT